MVHVNLSYLIQCGSNNMVDKNIRICFNYHVHVHTLFLYHITTKIFLELSQNDVLWERLCEVLHNMFQQKI